MQGRQTHLRTRVYSFRGERHGPRNTTADPSNRLACSAKAGRIEAPLRNAPNVCGSFVVLFQILAGMGSVVSFRKDGSGREFEIVVRFVEFRKLG